MSKLRRVWTVLTSLLMLGLCLVLILVPENGYRIVTAVLSFSLLLYGIRKIVFYFTMARHMVGGKLLLYMGFIVLNLGIFTGTLSAIPPVYVMLYLLSGYLFAGAIDLLRAFEAKRYGKKTWLLNLLKGVNNILIALGCLVLIFLGSQRAAVIVYAAGLAYSAVTQLIPVFRKTAVVYVNNIPE